MSSFCFEWFSVCLGGFLHHKWSLSKKWKFAFRTVKIDHSEQLNKSWNKSWNIIAILTFFAYADRALLTTFRKKFMLPLMTLFFGIFLTDFYILDVSSEILNNFHNISEEKRFVGFCFCFLYLCKQYCIFDL